MSRQRRMAPSGRLNSRKHVEWILSDWYCPKCGRQDMWQELPSGGDYYHDCSVTCRDCGYSMCCVDAVEDDK